MPVLLLADMLIYQFALFSVTGAGINLFSACGYVSQSFRICSLFKQFYFLELVRKIEIYLNFNASIVTMTQCATNMTGTLI